MSWHSYNVQWQSHCRWGPKPSRGIRIIKLRNICTLNAPGRLLWLEDKDIGETFIFLVGCFLLFPPLLHCQTKELDRNPQAYSCGQNWLSFIQVNYKKFSDRNFLLMVKVWNDTAAPGYIPLSVNCSRPVPPSPHNSKVWTNLNIGLQLGSTTSRFIKEWSKPGELFWHLGYLALSALYLFEGPFIFFPLYLSLISWFSTSGQISSINYIFIFSL